MNEYNEGDLLEAVKGETVIRGRRQRGEIGGSKRSVAALLHSGFTITVIEKAAPPLPAEDGIYAPHRRFVPGMRVLKRQGGAWCEASGQELDEQTMDNLHQWNREGRLTKFEPVHVTAKRVLDRVVEVHTRTLLSLEQAVETIASEFGVGTEEKK